MSLIYDLVIIGSGPAGMSAALYAKRAELNVLIIEKGAPGGKLLNTHKVDNLIGFEGKPGSEIAMKFYEHVNNFAIKYEFSEVISIENIYQKEKKIILKNNKEIITKSIIIATGMNPKKLDAKGYDQFFGKGISTCLICDGAFYRNKDILVVGGGNSAIEESLFASNIVNKIYIVNNLESLTAFSSIVKSFNKLKNVELINNSEVVEIVGKEKINYVNIINNKTKKITKLNVSGVFTYIGWIPSINFIKDKKILNDLNFVKANLKTNETLIPGVFAAGDIIEKDYRQITTAISDGTNAALSAKKYIDDLNN